MSSQNKCPICLENYDSNVNLKCKHKVCIRCFLKNIIHLNTKCPLCRDVIIETEPILIKFNEDMKILNQYRLEIFDLKRNNKNLKKELDKKNNKNNILNKISLNLGNSLMNLLENSNDDDNEEHEENDVLFNDNDFFQIT